jgi:segregation and condensation protein A
MSERMTYTVSTPVFEGPFDLLLELVSRERLDIWEVSISSIVDGFVSSLEAILASSTGLDLETATQFLLLAALLIELKSRRLLPGEPEADPEEVLAVFEQRDLLLARLLECKTFRNASAVMQQMMDRAALAWPRTTGPDERFAGLAPDLLEGVTAETLRQVMESLVAPRPEARVLLDHVAPVRASVRDTVEELSRRLPGAGRLSFREICSGAAERLEVVVRFLALLELYKEGLIELEQAGTFAELYATWRASELRAPEAQRGAQDADDLEYSG